MNAKSKHFTMRHLILGLGRVQRAANVKICGPGREKKVLERAQDAYDDYEKRARSEVPAEIVVAEQHPADDDGDMLMDGEVAQDPFEGIGFDDYSDFDEQPVELKDPFEDESFDDI